MNAPFIQKLSILITALFLLAALPAVSQTATQDIQPSHDKLQIEPERTVQLNVSEGIWMSLDVHPSGEKFVFEFMGNLFELPILGGELNIIASTNGRRTPHFVKNDDRIYLNHTQRGLISIHFDHVT